MFLCICRLMYVFVCRYFLSMFLCAGRIYFLCFFGMYFLSMFLDLFVWIRFLF